MPTWNGSPPSVCRREPEETGELDSRTSPKPRKVVALVGYMGSGKTTIGKELSSRLGWRFVDLDAHIESRAGRTIPEIFADSGEKGFRDIESDVFARIVDDAGDGAVISCGGGIVVREENRGILKHLQTVFVEDDIETLFTRTRGSDRPLRGVGREDFERRYLEREPLYRDVASLVLDCYGRGQYELAGEVARWLGR